MSLDCFDGFIDIKSYKFGLVTDSYDVNNKECSMINQKTISTNCNRQTNGRDSIYQDLMSKCDGKNRCELNVT